MTALLTAWLPGAHPDDFLAPLQAAIEGHVNLVTGSLEDVAAEVLSEVRVLVQGVPTGAHLAALPALRHVVIPWAGVHPSLAPLLADRHDVTVHNLHHNAAPTAEMAITLLLAAWKHLIPMDQALLKGDWRPRYKPPVARTVAGREITVLGYGAIGRRIARILVAMDAKVTSVRRTPGVVQEGDVRVVGREGLDEALGSADAVIVALPATSETDGLLDRRRIGALRRGAVVVNVARGRVLDEEALHRALQEGHVAAAGLDVWWHYPRDVVERSNTPPGSTSLYTHDRVVRSPHRGGMTRENDAARAEAVAHLLRQASAGAELDHRVDLARGY